LVADHDGPSLADQTPQPRQQSLRRAPHDDAVPRFIVEILDLRAVLLAGDHLQVTQVHAPVRGRLPAPLRRRALADGAEDVLLIADLPAHVGEASFAGGDRVPARRLRALLGLEAHRREPQEEEAESDSHGE